MIQHFKCAFRIKKRYFVWMAALCRGLWADSGGYGMGALALHVWYGALSRQWRIRDGGAGPTWMVWGSKQTVTDTGWGRWPYMDAMGLWTVGDGHRMGVTGPTWMDGWHCLVVTRHALHPIERAPQLNACKTKPNKYQYSVTYDTGKN